MADLAYNFFKQKMLDTAYDLSSLNVKAMLVRIGAGHYVVTQATDQFVSVIAGGDQIAISPQLTVVSITNGIFGAGPTVFAAVPAGPAAGAVVLFVDTGVQATSPLICYLDTYSGLPITPSGSDINLVFLTTGNKIFALV